MNNVESLLLLLLLFFYVFFLGGGKCYNLMCTQEIMVIIQTRLYLIVLLLFPRQA